MAMVKGGQLEQERLSFFRNNEDSLGKIMQGVRIRIYLTPWIMGQSIVEKLSFISDSK